METLEVAPRSSPIPSRSRSLERLESLARSSSYWSDALNTPEYAGSQANPDGVTMSIAHTPLCDARLSVRTLSNNNREVVLHLRLAGSTEPGAWVACRPSAIPGARHAAIGGLLEDSFRALKDGRQVQQTLSSITDLVEAGLVQVARLAQGGGRTPPSSDSLWAKTVRALANYRIPLLTWGSGSSKPHSSLINEIRHGESRLVDTGKELIRQVEVARVKVFYRCPDGQVLKLVEKGQYFSDGRYRQRKSEFSIAEKVGRESARTAAARAFLEELGIRDAPELEGGSLTGTRSECQDYPGLVTEKVFTNFTAWLSADQFKPEGYIEQQRDKRTVFGWEPVTSLA